MKNISLSLSAILAAVSALIGAPAFADEYCDINVYPLENYCYVSTQKGTNRLVGDAYAGIVPNGDASHWFQTFKVRTTITGPWRIPCTEEREEGVWSQKTTLALHLQKCRIYAGNTVSIQLWRGDTSGIPPRNILNLRAYLFN